MFFLLSGYTLKKREPAREYINLKFERLMIPYFYTCLAIILTDIFNTYALQGDKTYLTATALVGRDLIRSFFASGSFTFFGSANMGRAIGAIWFLPCMFWATLIFQLMLKYIKEDYNVGICCVICGVLSYISARFIWFPFSIQSGLMATGFVWLGYEIKQREVLKNIKWYYYVIAQILFLAGIYYNLSDVGFVSGNMADIILSIPVGLAGCLLIYFLSVCDEKGIVLSYIGKMSLTVLCTHLYALNTMGYYAYWILDQLQLEGNKRWWTLILIEILFAILVAAIIEEGKNFFNRYRYAISGKRPVMTDKYGKRDISVDIAKGILIVSMLVGHYAIDHTTRSIIYSCHMIAFVLFSGYFYKRERLLKYTVMQMVKGFILPYIAFVVGVILLNKSSWWEDNRLLDIIGQYVCGMSFSKSMMQNVPSVGPIWFVLMLFITRLLYAAICRVIENKRIQTGLVVCISLLGVKMGNLGWWLPWSADVAFYVMIFYHIGVMCKEYDILRKIRENHMCYFLLSSVWAYMIYAGGMEIATRRYGDYGVVVIGAVCGTLFIYQLSVYVAQKLPIIARVLSQLGKDSIMIIIIHTLLGGEIREFVAGHFYYENVAYFIFTIGIQIALSILVGMMIRCIRQGWNRGRQGQQKLPGDWTL